MKNQLLLIAFSLTTLAACQKNDSFSAHVVPDGAVINGSKVTSRNTADSKSVVIVELLGPSGAVRTACTGALVGKHSILTAAHCFDRQHVSNFASFRIVFANQFGVNNSGLIRKGLLYKQHPLYNSNGRYNYDFAMAIFAGDAPRGFNPAQMDSDTTADYGGAKLTVYGYGRSKDYTGREGEDLRDSVGVLHRGIVKVSSDYNQLGDLYLLKASSQSHVCQGDSGGPHFYNRNGVTKIVGVTSATYGKALANGQHSCLEFSQASKVAVNYAWFKNEERKALAQYYPKFYLQEL
ncbi:trypsin-like serine protease [Bdellovibrio sp. SKB1291214]|uniref:S1 family peptidase n=1 Tax=Bdellovibrio sp. SKB1291214 TaxID=1732569 RepID=UPI001130AB8D|nr:trypsin-like serine protease [Bdellovibrio sp. SKB1291214]UYL09756.1 trypsin-like serine protease [Bdellovibrio sp. SKB1291214]